MLSGRAFVDDRSPPCPRARRSTPSRSPSARPRWRRGFPRSHGPSEERVDAAEVNLSVNARWRRARRSRVVCAPGSVAASELASRADLDGRPAARSRSREGDCFVAPVRCLGTSASPPNPPRSPAWSPDHDDPEPDRIGSTPGTTSVNPLSAPVHSATVHARLEWWPRPWCPAAPTGARIPRIPWTIEQAQVGPQWSTNG